MMTESIGEFGAEPLFQFARAVGHAPVPFQIKIVDAEASARSVDGGGVGAFVDGGGVGAFDVVVLVFGSSPPSPG